VGKNMIFPVWQRTDMKKEETKRKKKVKTDLHHPLSTLFFLVKERTNYERWGARTVLS